VSFPAGEAVPAHLFVDVLTDSCTVDGRDGHHLQRVRRLRVGEQVTAADGAGSWRRYEIVASARGHLELAARSAIEHEPEVLPRVGLALALTKGGFDTAIARATELGVSWIEPLEAARSVARFDPARADHAYERWRAVVREAAAQSRRARLPEIRPLVALADLAARPGVLLADRTGVVAAELPPAPPAGWTVVVGPEGGFEPAEADRLSGAPRLAHGPFVLRAETAPVAAVAALMSQKSPGSV
jgi:16S rRNA (uracil1498-N3)-methyltransferase